MRKVRVYKIDLLVIDFDDVGADGVRQMLEHTHYPNRAISPDVMSIEEREVEWSDEHPLNHERTCEAAYRDLFEEPRP